MSIMATSSEIKSVLSDIGWDEGFSIPVANVENKELENEVLRFQTLIVQKRNEAFSCSEAMSATQEHTKNVKQELFNTLGLISARKKEIETEEHLTLVAEREEGRLRQEIKRLEKIFEDCKEKRNMHENNIFKQKEKLEEMKSQMNWDQQALEAWLEESARKDEDAMMLAKYSLIDEGKIKELSLRMERLTDEVHDKKKALDGAVTETMSVQIELDKTAEDFRQAHQDRQNLIKQWEKTIEQMQTRDTDMDKLAKELAGARIEIRQCGDLLVEKDNFLSQEKETNQEVERKIQLTERTASKVQKEYRESETNRQQFHNELDTLKRTVDRTAMDLEVTRSTVNHLKKDVNAQTIKLENVRDVQAALTEKLKVAANSTLTAEQRARQMEEFLADEKVHCREIEAKLKDLRDQRFKKTQQIVEMTMLEKVREAEIQGNSACIRNLNSKLGKLDHESLKQQEILYNQDFEIQQLERRISRMQGERSNEEQLILEKRIAGLQKDIDAKNYTINQLISQLKKLQEDHRRVSNDLERGCKQKDLYANKIQELELYTDSTERELRGTIKEKQDMTVDANLMKLEIKRLRDILNDTSDGVVTHEKRKLQLETAIKERQCEIDVHRTMLQAQLKTCDEERSQLNTELHERLSKIDKLRKRFEILMVSMAPPEGEEDHTQAYYVIKAAQQKEEIQREGDSLDAKIRKAEKEIKALENTVRLLNSRNETYRKSFNKITESSEEMEEKEETQEQLKAVMEKYRYKRRQLTEIEDDIKVMENNLMTLLRDEEAYSEIYREKQTKMVHLNRDLDDQKDKLERVYKQILRLKRDARNAEGSKHELPEERDIELRSWRDFNRTVIKEIGDVAQNTPDLQDPIYLVFSQLNLSLPTSSSGRKVSALSSSRSSTSSLLRSDSKLATPTQSVTVAEDADVQEASPRSSVSQASGRSAGSQL